MSGFSIVKLLSHIHPSFPCCTHWEEVPLHSSYSRIGELHSSYFRVEYLHNLFGILLHGRFLSSLPFIYISMDSDFYIIIYVTIKYYLSLKVFQFWTLGALFSCLLCPFDMSSFFFFFLTLNYFLYYKMLQAHFVCPNPKNLLFL